MRIVLPVLALALFLTACGEPKTIALDRMHTRSGSGQYYVVGQIMDVGNGIMRYKEGETVWSNVRLRDNTGEYWFHFLPSAHSRQPMVGDNVKLLIRGKFVDSAPGSPTAQLIEKFEFK